MIFIMILRDIEGQKKRSYLYDPKFPKCSYQNSVVLYNVLKKYEQHKNKLDLRYLHPQRGHCVHSQKITDAQIFDFQ